MFIQMLYGIRDADKGGIKEEDFSEVYSSCMYVYEKSTTRSLY